MWREDPDLWRRCLESYKTASGWAFMVVGVDGDEADDQEMIDGFLQVWRSWPSGKRYRC